MEKIVVVLTTLPEGAAIDELARTLLEGHHAACISVLPVQVSTYRWQGALETAREHQLLIKTTAGRVPALREAMRALHPYEVPEWLVIPVTGGDPRYLAWIASAGR
ncbi:MAG: divalent-cation tolerance protein CutA [Acidobacteria bacterium]|jgi:periplasmic divalent cation tolerance protein|nr:divalent-cation tolerance protein CutA [Acidobacteriota bacterium]